MRSNEGYWAQRYKEEMTGWDIGAISTPLKYYIDQIQDKSIRILIPGGGNAHEAEYLFNNGFKNLYLNDIARQPLANFKTRVSSFPDSNLLLKDFFDVQQQFDLILEQTFFCALPVTERTAYVEKMYELLLPGGKLAGVLFNTHFEKDGPPFGGSREEYITLFSKKFYIKTLENCYNSISPRQGNELFFIFIKKIRYAQGKHNSR